MSGVHSRRPRGSNQYTPAVVTDLAHWYLRQSGSVQGLLTVGLMATWLVGITALHFWPQTVGRSLDTPADLRRRGAAHALGIALNSALAAALFFCSSVMVRAGTMAPFGTMAGRPTANPSALGTGLL